MGNVKVKTPKCIVCERTSHITAPEDAVRAWRAGEFIQKALYMLSADEREMLMSGTHPQCFDLIEEDFANG